MGVPWSRVVNTTIKDYIRDEEVNVLRNRKLSALFKKKGRISYNHSGLAVQWPVRYKRVNLVPFAGGDTLDFARKDRFKTASIDWRGYSATDSMEKSEYLQNRSTEAIVKVYENTAKMLMDDVSDAFGEEFYKNGYLSQNAKRMHGIESFMSASANDGNIGASPTATNYAGLSCVPGAYGGTWASAGAYNGKTNNGWPNGKGDAQFDFWSPIIVDFGDSALPGGSGTRTWAANCVEAISFGIIKSKKSKSQKGMLDLIMSDDEMYRQYLTAARTKERILVQRSAEQSALVALGFTDVVNQDGVDITWEYGIANGVGYGFNIDEVELLSQQAQIFVPEGPDFDMASKSWRFSVDFFGNLKWNPKFQVKFINLGNTGDSI